MFNVIHYNNYIDCNSAMIIVLAKVTPKSCLDKHFVIIFSFLKMMTFLKMKMMTFRHHFFRIQTEM